MSLRGNFAFQFPPVFSLSVLVKQRPKKVTWKGKTCPKVQLQYYWGYVTSLSDEIKRQVMKVLA
jgi:hypothetical protein